MGISYYTEFDAVTVDRVTGEIGGAIPAGSKIMTPEDLEREERAKELKRLYAEGRTEKILKRRANKNERFYFVSSEAQMNLPEVDAARMIYLSTFVSYNADILTRGYKKIPVKKSDLPKILRVSSDTANRFLKSVSPNFLTVDSNGVIHVNTNWFWRGKLSTKEFKNYQQFYDYNVRRLYESATSLKRVGYVFNMLPFINREWNVLSLNPEEKEQDKVIPMSAAEFCDLAGLDKSNIQRTLREIRSVRFKTDRGLERFCSGVDDGAVIVVNPNVLYVGSNESKVKIYNLFFRDVK